MGTTAKGVPGGLATLDNNGRVPAGQAPQAEVVADLVMTVGTADGTIADVGGAFNQTTLNNNFRDVGAKINEIMGALRDAGILAES
jgi:hypothetical protein